MKTVLLFLGAASMIGDEAAPSPQCVAPSTAGKSAHNRFDPIVIDLKGDGVAKVASACSVATGNDSAAIDAKEIKLKPIKGDVKATASQNGQSLRVAIDAEGTGAAAGAAASDPNIACGDSVARSGARPAPREALLGTKVAAAGAAEPACIAINEKGELK